MTKADWREATLADLAEIGAIAARMHPDLAERIEVFAEKMRLFPAGCRVLVADGEIVGYGLAHPWRQQQIPPLDDFLGRLPDDADCLYVHDVAVLPGFRGGAARAFVAAIETQARASGLAALALVSVYATQPVWRVFGFQPVTADAEQRAKLASYGPDATYMLRDLAGAPRTEA